MKDDTFEIGQWLKGRIYERRCDLSPEGDLLMYFAASWRKPYQSWSAVSRPPFLTALALWPKGNAWGGGGQFESRNRILLNHQEWETELAENFSVPKWATVTNFGEYSGGGEDDPVWSSRLTRDGWVLTRVPGKTKPDWTAKVTWVYEPPLLWEKAHPVKPGNYILQMSVLGIDEKDGSWYVAEHSVVSADGTVISLGRSEWADWSPKGDLLYSQGGRLYRLRWKHRVLAPIEATEEIADFSELKFQQCEAPGEARQWPPMRKK
jgi:hypothetical protein